MSRRLAVLLACCALLPSCARPRPAADDYGPVGDFSLTERSGRTVTAADLRGKVWVASFVFTRCSGGCPQVTATMQGLQSVFARLADVRLVTFTVDPDHDDPQELANYAGHYQADPQRWLFLTGPEADVYRLLRDGFHITARQNEGKERTPGNEVLHDTRLVLVDRDGHIRGYYDGLPMAPPKPAEDADEATRKRYAEEAHEAAQRYEEGLRELRAKVATLESGGLDFPLLNAALNAVCLCLLLFGYLAIRLRRVRLHVACMLLSLTVSAVFLTSYLYYHIVVRHGQATRFEDRAPGAPAWLRWGYLAILVSHTVLAAVVTPLALFTAWQGLRNRLGRHVRVARWTLPLWLYVSATGVVVYLMLYRLYPRA
jgi:protein SCO1/2/putative membrane protein